MNKCLLSFIFVGWLSFGLACGGTDEGGEKVAEETEGSGEEGSTDEGIAEEGTSQEDESQEESFDEETADTGAGEDTIEEENPQDAAGGESAVEITLEVSGREITVNNLGACGSQTFDSYGAIAFDVELTCSNESGEETHLLSFSNITYSAGQIISFDVIIDDRSYSYNAASTGLM